MLLKKEDIIKVDKRKVEEVDVPEWGGKVRIREMSAAQRDAFDASTVKFVGKKATPNLENTRAKLLSFCIVDENGELMFSVQELSELNSKAIEPLAEKARKLNGLDDAALDGKAKN